MVAVTNVSTLRTRTGRAWRTGRPSKPRRPARDADATSPSTLNFPGVTDPESLPHCLPCVVERYRLNKKPKVRVSFFDQDSVQTHRTRISVPYAPNRP